MTLYFFLHDAERFFQQIGPALGASWRERSFAPCQELCNALASEVRAFQERYYAGAEEPLLERVARGIPFDRNLWRLLAGEVLLYAAAEVPDLQTAPDALCCLLAPEAYRSGESHRENFSPIQQVHFGSRDLTFAGAYYQPERAGLNDLRDVARLADYLASVNPTAWSPADLEPLPNLRDAEDRADELEFVRDWFGPLREMYERARQRGWVVVCEVL
jgi:hypothetical protein